MSAKLQQRLRKESVYSTRSSPTPRESSSLAIHQQVLALVRGGLDSLNGWLNGASARPFALLVSLAHLPLPTVADLKPLCPSSEEEEVSFSCYSDILAPHSPPRCRFTEQCLVYTSSPNLPPRSLPSPLSHDFRQALLRRSRRLVGRCHAVVSRHLGRAGSEDSAEGRR